MVQPEEYVMCGFTDVAFTTIWSVRRESRNQRFSVSPDRTTGNKRPEVPVVCDVSLDALRDFGANGTVWPWSQFRCD